MSSPRYLAEHMLLPRFVRERGATEVLDAIAREDTDYFIPVWMTAGFRFSPLMFHNTYGELTVGILTLPQPRAMLEAYLAAVVGKPSDPTYCRYFLWETSESVLDARPRTVLGEWTDSTHRNHGNGPEFTGDLANDAAAFVAQVLRACGEPAGN